MEGTSFETKAGKRGDVQEQNDEEERGKEPECCTAGAEVAKEGEEQD